MSIHEAIGILARRQVSQELDWQARRVLGMEPEPVTIHTDLRIAAMSEYAELEEK